MKKNIIKHKNFNNFKKFLCGLGGVRGEESASPGGVTGRPERSNRADRQRDAGATSKEHRLACPPRCEAGRNVSPYGSNPKGVILFLFLLGLSAILVYGNSLHSPFIWDDPYLITDNHFIKSSKYLGEIFKRHLYYSTAGMSNFYRPLQTLFLMLDYSFWKNNPFGYHLTSLLFHIANGFLIFLIIDLIFKRRFVAFLVTLLFLGHPVNSTVVDYISSRADSQATLFLLLSFWLFFKYAIPPPIASFREAKRWGRGRKGRGPQFYYFASLLSFILALLSKELAVILPLLLLVSLPLLNFKTQVYVGRNLKVATTPVAAGFNLRLGRTIPFFIILAIYGLLRLTVLSFAAPASGSPPSLYIRLLTTSHSFVKLIGLLFAPLAIHMEKSIPFAKTFFEPIISISLLILGAIGVFLFWIRRYSKLCLFGFIWFFLCLLPMANIIPINATLADHWLYLPGIGFFLAIIGGWDDLVIRRLNLRAIRGLSITFYGLIIIPFSALTMKQNTVWKDPVKFYQWTLKYSPDSFRPHNELGVIYLNQNQYKEAIIEFQKAVSINPNFDQAYDNLGIALDKNGQLQEAIPQYKKALSLNPNNAKTYNNLANTYNKLNQFDAAIETYEKALRLNPGFKAVYNNLGVIYYKKGMLKEAAKQWKKALEIDPHFEVAANNLKIVQEELAHSQR